MDFLDCINTLNEELHNRYGYAGDGFNYSTNGFIDVIKFEEIILFNSDDEEREWLEDNNDYEPMYNFLKRKFNNEIDRLFKLKF